MEAFYIPEATESRKALSEELRFFFDKRLELFNVRRTHEWQVFFAMATLIGLTSYALLDKSIELNEWQQLAWGAALALLLGFHFAYQKGVQQRNRVDRLVMDRIAFRMCELMGLDENCFIRFEVDGADPNCIEYKKIEDVEEWWNGKYAWAFFLQNTTIFLLCIGSILIAVGSVKKAPEKQEKTTAVQGSDSSSSHHQYDALFGISACGQC